MALAFAGTCILLGAIAFYEWKGKRRPLSHWLVLSVSVVAIIAILLLWVGEYRIENQHLPR